MLSFFSLRKSYLLPTVEPLHVDFFSHRFSRHNLLHRNSDRLCGRLVRPIVFVDIIIRAAEFELVQIALEHGKVESVSSDGPDIDLCMLHRLDDLISFTSSFDPGHDILVDLGVCAGLKLMSAVLEDVFMCEVTYPTPDLAIIILDGRPSLQHPSIGAVIASAPDFDLVIGTVLVRLLESRVKLV